MKKYGLKDGLRPYEVGAILLGNIQQIQVDGDLALDEFYVSSIVKYRRIIALMQGFFTAIDLTSWVVQHLTQGCNGVLLA